MDLSILKDLVGNDDTTLRELLSLYLRTARRLQAELRAACAVGDLHKAGAIAHQLKSSSLSVGASYLGDLYAILERAGKAGDLAAIKQHMGSFDDALAQVEAEIEAFLNTKDA